MNPAQCSLTLSDVQIQAQEVGLGHPLTGKLIYYFHGWAGLGVEYFAQVLF